MVEFCSYFSHFLRAAHHATGTFTRNTPPPPKQLCFTPNLLQTIANSIMHNTTCPFFDYFCCCGGNGSRVWLIFFLFFARAAHHAMGTFMRNTPPPSKQLCFTPNVWQTIANSIVHNTLCPFFDLFCCCGDIGGRVLLIFFSFFAHSPSCNQYLHTKYSSTSKIAPFYTKLVANDSQLHYAHYFCCCGRNGSSGLLIFFSFFAHAAHHAMGTFTQNTPPPPPKQLCFMPLVANDSQLYYTQHYMPGF